jgi:5-methylthioadenosine/S-adenosylhomocysteine deaminase
MMTIGGARALGLEKEIGSVEVGKKADIILIDFNQLHLLPDARYVPKLVYSTHGSDVKDVIIDGQLVMENHKVTTLSEEKVMARAMSARKDLIAMAGQDTRDLLAAPWPKQGPYWRAITKEQG